MVLIADYVTVWRCWVVWDRNWKVVVVPFLLVLPGTAFCIVDAIFEIDPNSGLASSQFNKFAKFSMVYFILSLCSTVICTVLIVYRIISVSKRPPLVGPYKKILEIIVESAALYSTVLIIYLPFLAKDDFSDGYPQALLIGVTGIAPTLIMTRVSVGVSRDYSAARASGIGMGAADNTTTRSGSISRTMFDETSNESGSLSQGRKDEPNSVA